MPDVDAKPLMSGWARVELLGHRTVVGFVREVEMLDTRMLKIEVPEGRRNVAFVQFYGASAIFAITPVRQEEVQTALHAGHYLPHVPDEYRKEYGGDDADVPF